MKFLSKLFRKKKNDPWQEDPSISKRIALTQQEMIKPDLNSNIDRLLQLTGNSVDVRVRRFN